MPASDLLEINQLRASLLTGRFSRYFTYILDIRSCIHVISIDYPDEK